MIFKYNYKKGGNYLAINQEIIVTILIMIKLIHQIQIVLNLNQIIKQVVINHIAIVNNLIQIIMVNLIQNPN